ncbi:MAG: hypothetical protein AAF730_10300 [Bacteroidota bacterium]
MKHAQRFGFLTLLGLTLIASGCETNVAGPQGPPGRDGVIDVFAVNFTFSMQDAAINGNVASVQFDVQDITRNVVENGAVMLYFREQGTWTAMPYTYGVESPDLAAVDYTISLGFGYDERLIEVFYEASTDAVDLSTQPDLPMRAVIIDGFFAGKQGAPVDLTDYDAVADYYGLTD